MPESSPESRLLALETALSEVRGELAAQKDHNQRLITTLRDAREQIVALKAEVDRLGEPPCGFGTFIEAHEDGSVDIVASGRKLRVAVSPGVGVDSLLPGQEVVLNESMNIVGKREYEVVGEIVTFKEMLGTDRCVVVANADEERVMRIGSPLHEVRLRAGEALLCDMRSGYVVEQVPRAEVEELVLEEVPDIDYTRIGGLGSQIDSIRDAVELPYLHAELFAEHDLRAPKGILLYGPPGCGKTLIAKAVANSLAKKVAEKTGHLEAKSYFLNIKGPELLNKYVGETERHIRLVFQRAREKASEGMPVIVFFDEMDSMFRARGTGVSSDMESTVVPQLLAELDGVEGLSNVIVIGATNREDLIDPAILRPGRLDVKIKVDRPDERAARSIFARYITRDVPIDVVSCDVDGDLDSAVNVLVEASVGAMFATGDDNEFLEVTYQNGDREVLHYRDFASGAMIENIVRRAKKDAIKREISGGSRGLTVGDLVAAVRQEFRENDDLPNTTNPDDWARISGRKGERIVFIRTLSGDDKSASNARGGKAIERSVSGQYL